MNIFKKYGIKEVADVTFYSITRIGQEEFYIPVLYFDTLKVSTLDKSVETVTAMGGKGNGKILSWNFQKDLKVKLEDALFSQMSLDTFMNGRVMAKLSDWTSAIAKLNVANKYGQKNYSIKAFPSPELTAAEWEIVYRCAQKAGFDPRYGSNREYGVKKGIAKSVANAQHDYKYQYDTDDWDESDDAVVAENRYILKKNYYNRTQPQPKSIDLAPYLDYNTTDYEGVSVTLVPQDYNNELKEAKEVAALELGKRMGGWRDLIISFRKKTDDNGDNNYKWETMVSERSKSAAVGDATTDNRKFLAKLHYSFEKTLNGCKCVWAYISVDNFGQEFDRKTNNPVTATRESTVNILSKVFTGFNKSYPAGANLTQGTTGGYNPTFHIGNEFFMNHILYFLFPNYLEDAITDLCWCDLRNKFYKAMPQEVIDQIALEIDTFARTGCFENDLYEAKVIDRMEKCVVTELKGQKIDLIQQLQNVKKMYNNEQETFTVYYDSKTMLPFMNERFIDEKILDQKCVRIYSTQEEKPLDSEILEAIKSYLQYQYNDEWVNSITYSDYVVNAITDQYGSLVKDNNSKYVEKEEKDEDGNPVMIVEKTMGDSIYNDDNKTDGEGFPIISGDEQTTTYDYVRQPQCYLIYFKITKRDYITLKRGTVYYKWSRTIDDDNTENTFIGTDLSIDVDTFGGEYMIVGETLIREQQTGKDQRYQLLLPRTTISASTSLKLQASGDPTTFSIDVNVLVPVAKNKSMIELRQYNVEEDKVEGGTRIVPQDKRHSYTPTSILSTEEIVANNEIY